MEMLNENEITGFFVSGKFFRLIATNHAIKRIKQRRLNKYQIASAILGLGTKLEMYNNSGKQILISDKDKNLSTIFAIEKYNIVLVTVLDKANPYVKENTVVESFSFQYA
jgi:hypothetical protein